MSRRGTGRAADEEEGRGGEIRELLSPFLASSEHEPASCTVPYLNPSSSPAGPALHMHVCINILIRIDLFCSILSSRE
jgi:hypothetical protein